eukprot:COSAG02_NODE_807_length_16930_cov_21.113719_8_plen_832_part_00
MPRDPLREGSREQLTSGLSGWRGHGMFAGAFHGGASVEVFTAQGSAPLKDWKVSGKPKKLYDKEVKSFIFDLDGMSKIQVPKDERGALALTQGFLALQVKIPPSKGIAVEIALIDTTRKRRRIVCNSGNKETVATALHARVPMGPIQRGIWLNLCFDVRDMTARLWPGTEFQSVELISVGAACKLRRIATLRGALVDTTEDDVKLGCDRTIWQATPVEEAPKSWHFLPGVQYVNQIFHMHKLYAWEAAARGETYTPPGSQTAEAMERLGDTVSPSQAKFPAAREGALSAASSAQVAFGRRIEQAGASRPPGTAGSRAQTAGSRVRTPGTSHSRLQTPSNSAGGHKGASRGGTAGSKRSSSRVDSGLGPDNSQRSGRASTKDRSPNRSGRTSAKRRSPIREARQQRKPLSGLDARADERRQEAASRGAVEDVMGVLAQKDAQMAEIEAAVAKGGSLATNHQLAEEMEFRSPLGGGWDGSPRSERPIPEPEPEPRWSKDRQRGAVRQSAELRQQEIERKRAHLARLEESYMARFGGPAVGSHAGQQTLGALKSEAGAASPVPSHAGSVAEELVEYADSVGTGGEFEENEGGGDRGRGGRSGHHYERGQYDRNRYSDEADNDLNRHGDDSAPGFGTEGSHGFYTGGSPKNTSIGFADDDDYVRLEGSQSQSESYGGDHRHSSSSVGLSASGGHVGPESGEGAPGMIHGQGVAGSDADTQHATPQKLSVGDGTGLSPEGYSGQAAFEARLAGLERSFTPPLVPPSNLRTVAASTSVALGADASVGGSEPGGEQLGQRVKDGSGGGGGAEEIDLLYDPILSCYYDPKTNKYYELRT